MAKGPTYHVPFRRRREGKTNYYQRRSLLMSGKRRAVIRPSNKHVVCQIVEAHLKGDRILLTAHSKEILAKYGWTHNTGNLPTAYLVGYLLGKKAMKAGIEEAVADIGLRIHINRTWAALKGIIDSGLALPHSEEIFPEDDRISGKHIEEYAKLLKEEGGQDQGESEGSKPHVQFTGKADPTKISSSFEKVKKKIDEEFK